MAKTHPIFCDCKRCFARKYPSTHAANQEKKRRQQQSQRSGRPDRYRSNNQNWHRPVHGTTADGRPVTASFGKDGSKAEGNTGIADGHVSEGQYYGKDGSGVKGHDHYGPNGESLADRGRYTD